MGTNAKAGELRQLFVSSNVWKFSQIPPADLEAAKTQEEKDHTGCLITEVVTPGFHWEDHKFLTMKGLQQLYEGVDSEGTEEIKQLAPFVKKSNV